MTSFDFIFKPKGLSQIVEGQKALVKQAGIYESKLIKSQGISQSSLGTLQKQKDAWQKIATSTTHTAKEIETAQAMVDKFAQKLSEIENPFNEIMSSMIPFGGIITDKMNKVEGLVSSFQKVEQAGGFTKVLGDKMSNFGEKTKMLGGFMKKAFGGGLKGMIASIGTSFSALLPIIGTLMASIWPITAAIAAIVVAVFVLKRMWKNNIGGMQTQFMKFIGMAKDMWNKFIVGFDKLLRKVSPLVKIVIGALMLPLIWSLKYVSTLFKVLFMVLEPIFDVFGEIGKIIGEMFGDGSKKGMDFMKVMDAILMPVLVLGKILSWVVRIVLLPMLLTFKLIGWYVGKVKEGFGKLTDGIKAVVGWFMKFEFVKKIMKGVQDSISKTKDFLMAMIEPFKWIIDGAKKVAEWLGFGGDETEATTKKTKELKKAQGEPVSVSQISNNKNTTVNNNNNVAVHSSGAITEDSAPGIGNTISASLITGARVT